jgi:hypothetical protein
MLAEAVQSEAVLKELLRLLLVYRAQAFGVVILPYFLRLKRK